MKYIAGFGEVNTAEVQSAIRQLTSIGGQKGQNRGAGGGARIKHPDVSVGKAFYNLLHEYVLPFTAKLMIGSVVKVGNARKMKFY